MVARTALEDLCGTAVESVNDDQLYRALDKVDEHKDRLCQHLMETLPARRSRLRFPRHLCLYFSSAASRNDLQ